MADLKPLSERLNIQSAADITPYVNLFVYSDPGVGKTRLISTAQDHEDTSPLLVLDVDGGTATFRDRKDIGVITVRSMADVEKVWKELDKDMGGYKTVALDSMTELQKLDMKYIMKTAYDRNPEKVDIEVPSPREWGKSSEHMRAITRAFRDLPCHTIFTALCAAEHENAKEQEGPINYDPDLSPRKLKKQIPGFLDVVGYMTVKEVNKTLTRQIQFAKTRRVNAKDRFDCLGDLMENPTIPLIWSKIQNKFES